MSKSESGCVWMCVNECAAVKFQQATVVLINMVDNWVERQICPSHRGLDIISLCFPQLAQPTQCKPQDCIVKQTEPGVRRGPWQAAEDEQGLWKAHGEGRNVFVHVASLTQVSDLCICVYKWTKTHLFLHIMDYNLIIQSNFCFIIHIVMSPLHSYLRRLLKFFFS